MLRKLFGRNRWEREMDDEIRIHLENRAADLQARGLSADHARRQAQLEFGSRESWKEEIRHASGFRLLDELRQDVRYAFRTLRHSRVFATVSIASLALGIGANTVVFSFVNSLLLNPINVPDESRIWSVNEGSGPAHSFPNYRDVRDRNSVFESLYAYRIAPMAVDGPGGTELVWGYLATGNYFDSMKIRPALGRFFTPSEDRQVGGSAYAVLSHASWRNRFGSDPSIVGKAIRINRRAYEVLGVAPPGFHGTEAFYWPEIWVPMSMQPHIETYAWLEERRNHNSWVGGRLKPGISKQQAEADLAVVAAGLAREHRSNEGLKLTLSRPGLAGAMGRDPLQAFGVGVMLLAGLVLLAACANLAGLMSARTTDRFRELSIRASLGASRGRVLRQLGVEALIIATAGGAAGWALASAALTLLTRWRAPMDIPLSFDVRPDWRVLAFAFVVSLATAALFALGPMRQGWILQPAGALKGGQPSERRRRWAFRDALLPVQIALCSILVMASVVAARGLGKSLETPLGLDPKGLVFVSYDVGLGGHKPPEGKNVHERVLTSVSALPGVASAALASTVPLHIDQSTTVVYRDDTTDFRPRNSHAATYYQVSHGYFTTVGTRLLAGREFTQQDRKDTPLVVVINEVLARKLYRTTDVVGRQLRLGPKESAHIVGVVETGKYQSLTEDPRPALFYPLAQSYSPNVAVLVRTVRPEGEVASDVQRAVHRIASAVPIYGSGAYGQVLGLVYLPGRAAAIALGAFGVLALMLAITGIYGIAAYAVSRRVREIGIRVAIGARPVQVLRSVLGRVVVLTTVGALAGLALSAAAAQILSSIVYQATPRDPVVIIGAVATLGAAALAAALGPARRALQTDAVTALRSE